MQQGTCIQNLCKELTADCGEKCGIFCGGNGSDTPEDLFTPDFQGNETKFGDKSACPWWQTGRISSAQQGTVHVMAWERDDVKSGDVFTTCCSRRVCSSIAIQFP